LRIPQWNCNLERIEIFDTLGVDLIGCRSLKTTSEIMTLIQKSEIRNVTGITDSEAQRICDYLQGAVYCWCKNRSEEWFSVRDLFGGENFDWTGTPIGVLYEKHISKGKSDDNAISDAGKDAGWILKKIIEDDLRNFETKKEELIRKYRWRK